MDKCPDCGGAGNIYIPPFDIAECYFCNGTGVPDPEKVKRREALDSLTRLSQEMDLYPLKCTQG